MVTKYEWGEVEPKIHVDVSDDDYIFHWYEECDIFSFMDLCDELGVEDNVEASTSLKHPSAPENYEETKEWIRKHQGCGHSIFHMEFERETSNLLWYSNYIDDHKPEMLGLKSPEPYIEEVKEVYENITGQEIPSEVTEEVEELLIDQ